MGDRWYNSQLVQEETDYLAELWDSQYYFTKDMLKDTRKVELGKIEGKELISITEKYILSMHKELSEVLDGLDWKEHRKDNQPQVRSNIIEELIDVQKYVWGLMQIWNVDVEEFISEFEKKTFVVNERWRMEKYILGDKIIVCDIDGVLYQHDKNFREWIEQAKPHMKDSSKKDNALAWEESKWEFRDSEQHRYGDAYKENIQALNELKNKGWDIVLMTYRPKKVFTSLEYDTLYWLKANGVPYDKLIWAAYEKYFYMRDEMRNAEIFIDDEYGTCKLVSSLGKRVYWVSDDDVIPEEIEHDTIGVMPVMVQDLQEVLEIENELSV